MNAQELPPIDITKPLQTESGYPVENVKIVMGKIIGDVTFPDMTIPVTWYLTGKHRLQGPDDWNLMYRGEK